MRKQKKILITIAFLIVFIIVNSIFDFALVPPGLTRVILHDLESNDDYKCIILGTSHGSYGIDADIVSQESGIKTMNLCIGGEYLQDSYYLLKEAFLTNNPETVVIDVDFQYLINVPKNSVAANFIYNSYPNSFNKLSYFKDKIVEMQYCAALFPWMDYRNNFTDVKNIIKTKQSPAYINFSANAVVMELQDQYYGNGFIYRKHTDNLKNDTLADMAWDESNVDQQSIEYLKKIIDLCNLNNAKIIMMTMPVSIETISNSVNGYDNAYTYLSKLAKDNNIEYYNFSLVKKSVFPRSIEDYWDYDGHLYGDAAQRFSVVLGDFFKDAKDGNVGISNYLYDSVRDIH